MGAPAPEHLGYGEQENIEMFSRPTTVDNGYDNGTYGRGGAYKSKFNKISNSGDYQGLDSSHGGIRNRNRKSKR